MALGSVIQQMAKELYRVAGRVLWQRVVGEDRVPVLGVGLLDVQAALLQTSRGIEIWMCPYNRSSGSCRQVAPQKMS